MREQSEAQCQRDAYPGKVMCANPTPQTVEDFLDQKLMRLHEELHRVGNEMAIVLRLKARTPMIILRSPASLFRDLAQYL